MSGDTTRSSPPEKGRPGRGRHPAGRFDRTTQKTERARRLRREATPSERKLWACLESAQIEGVSFRRQHPVGAFVLDFYAPSLSLAIEVDGGQHGTHSGTLADRRRDARLRARGITILRFWNSDIMDTIEGVVETIRCAILERRKAGAGTATRSPPLEKGRSEGDQTGR